MPPKTTVASNHARYTTRQNTYCAASLFANVPDPDTSACKGGRFNVPEVTDLVRKARGIQELAARQQIYAQIAKLQIENVMDIQLVYPSTSVVLTPKVGGFQVFGDGFMRWDEVTIQS
jgi:peptide/nickel transport system substrate-binding protein